jgi:hypothetical protein
MMTLARCLPSFFQLCLQMAWTFLTFETLFPSRQQRKSNIVGREPFLRQYQGCLHLPRCFHKQPKPSAQAAGLVFSPPWIWGVEPAPFPSERLESVLIHQQATGTMRSYKCQVCFSRPPGIASPDGMIHIDLYGSAVPVSDWHFLIIVSRNISYMGSPFAS